MILLKAPFSYSKIAKEDPEEVRHRKALYLIYKILEESDSITKRPTPWTRKASKIRVKVGKRMKRIRVFVRRIRVWMYKRVVKYINHVNKVCLRI
ncbi:hypothetical protein LUZ60_010767 [Juncus effusus]|nr:hypothetical protein LUZ60_010767 [Juncus effusus]